MGTCPPRLYLMMQFSHIMGQCQQRCLRLYILFPAAQKSPETYVLLYVPERAFHLYTPVHSQLTSFFTYDSFQILFPVLHKFFRYLQCFAPFLQGLIAMIPLYAFLFVRAASAFLAAVYTRFPFIACFCPSFFYLD